MSAVTTNPPNLLWIMTDQQRADALSCHGGAACTPVLDALAARGADLREHCAQSPVCVPSRCTMFTGRYPQAHLCRENDARLSPHEAHLPKILKQAGYHLGYFGKNHLLPDVQMAEPNLDRVDLCADTGESDAQRAYHDFSHAALRRLKTHGVHGSAQFHDFPDEATQTGRIGNAAIGYLHTAPAGHPWSAVVSFADPHVPHLAPRRLAALYPDAAITLPDFAPGHHVNRHPRFALKRQAQGADRTTVAEKRRYLACYYAMCTFVDEQIGRILAALQARPDAADTIVLFTSDHGDFAWRHGLGKKDLILCDELLRVPCLITWPGHVVPRPINGTFTEHADLVPTLLDLMGLAAPLRGPQGRSFAPLLRGETDRHRDSTSSTVCYPDQRNPYATYASFISDWEQHAGQSGHLLSHTAPFNVPGTFTCSLRTRDWRYVWYADGFEELFDFRHDPDEWRNLAADPGHAAILTELRRQCFENHLRLEDPGSPLDHACLLATYPKWRN